jgi:hypothetical protein
MIDFLVEYVGMTRREACEEIGIDPDEIGYVLEERHQEWERALVSPPSDQWQVRGLGIIGGLRRRQTLYLPAYAHALDYLHARGFTDEIIQKFDLQYLYRRNDGSWLRDAAEQWGLSPDDYADGKLKLPEGIVIPWFVDGKLCKLEVRRLLDVRKDKDGKPIRYMPITGSTEHVLFNVDAIRPDKPVVLTESAFDAIAGEQVAGDLATFVATGGVGKAQYDRWVKRLALAPYVLVAFDDDEAGDKGSEFWRDSLPNTMRWAPWAHDINDMLRAGEDIRDWLTDGMEAYELIEKAKKLPVKPAPQQQPVPAPAQSQPLQGNERKQKMPYSYPALVDRVEMMQQLGSMTFQIVDGRVEVDAPYELTRNMQAFIQDHTPLIKRWLQSRQAVEQSTDTQPTEQERSSSCCRCGEPAEHFAPLGTGYCTKHYVCADGHVPNWVQRDGVWVCGACQELRDVATVERVPVSQQAEQEQEQAMPEAPKQSFWERIEAQNARFDPAKPVDWQQYGFKRNQQGRWFYARKDVKTEEQG